MNPGQIMFLVWPVVVLVLFHRLSAHRALIITMLLGWLALPYARLVVAGVEIGKHDMERLPILVGALVFQWRILASFRPRWFDLPAVIYTLLPLVTGLANGLGLEFSLVALYREVVFVLIPYFLARALIRTTAELREFGIAFAAATVLYVPLCLFEVRYGLFFSEWLVGSVTGRQSRGAERGGTYRPTVLLWDGFMLTMMQGFGFLLLFWLWLSKVLRTWKRIPVVCFAALPLLVVLLARSIGSILLMFVGLLTLLAVSITRLRFWFAALLLIAPLYVSLRMTGVLPTETLVAPVKKLAPAKVRSFEFRLRVEDAVAREMPRKPILGFGYFGLWREGKRPPHLDGFWLFTVTRTGYAGLVAWLSFFLLPPLLFLIRIPPRDWATPQWGTAAVFAVFIALLTIDALHNNHLAAPFLALLGSLSTVVGGRAVPRTG